MIYYKKGDKVYYNGKRAEVTKIFRLKNNTHRFYIRFQHKGQLKTRLVKKEEIES